MMKEAKSWRSRQRNDFFEQPSTEYLKYLRSMLCAVVILCKVPAAKVDSPQKGPTPVSRGRESLTPQCSRNVVLSVR